MPEFVLKDWYGKDQTFDEETIYVQNKEGQLLSFNHGSGNPVIEPLSVTENGTYNPPDGVNGYSPVEVAVPTPEIKLQNKTITENGEYAADSGFDGLGNVTVQVAGSGGGGDSFLETPIVKTGTFVATNATMTITHDLGVLPDCIAISCPVTNYSDTRSVVYAIGFRKGLTFPFGGQQDITTQETGRAYYMGWTTGIDENGISMGGFRKANASSVTFGGSVTPLEVNTTYEWKAIRMTQY